MHIKNKVLIIDYVFSFIMFLLTIGYIVVAALCYPWSLITDFPYYAFLFFQSFVLLISIPYILWRKEGLSKIYILSFILLEVIYLIFPISLILYIF